MSNEQHLSFLGTLYIIVGALNLIDRCAFFRNHVCSGCDLRRSSICGGHNDVGHAAGGRLRQLAGRTADFDWRSRVA